MVVRDDFDCPALPCNGLFFLACGPFVLQEYIMCLDNGFRPHASPEESFPVGELVAYLIECALAAH